MFAGDSPFNAGPAVPSMSVEGVTYEQVSAESTQETYYLRWPQIPGASALSKAVEKMANTHLETYRAENVPGEDSTAELHVNGEVIAAFGQIAGVRLTAAVPQGAKGAINHATLYGDAKGSWSVTSPELIEKSKQAEFVKLVTEGAKKNVPQGAFTGLRGKPEEALSDLTFTPEGNVRVVIDQGLLSASTEGTPWTEIPAAQATAFLSERGKAVVEAVRSKAPYGAQAPKQPEQPAPAPAGKQPAVDCKKAKCIALTYDDGPGAHTEAIANELSKAGAKGTFFMLGQSARAHPDVVRRVAAAGHEIEGHTWDHRDLARLPKAKITWEIDSAAKLLRELSGQPVKLLRPPYGSMNNLVKAAGYPIIMWDVDTMDWKNRNPATTTQKALATAKPGSIILMHDIHQSSAKATPGIVAKLKAQGYSLVTVSELLGEMTPGKVYTRG